MKRMLLSALLVLLLAIPVFAQDALTLGEIVEGQLSNSVDTYEFDAEAGQAFFISLTSEEFDTFAEILDAAGDRAASDDDSGPGSSSQLVFVAPDTATYSLIARSYGGVGNGAYTLLVDSPAVSDLGVGDELEVSLGGEDLPSAIYTLVLDEPTSLTISARSDSQLDTNLRVLGPDGVEIAYDEDSEGIDPVINSQEFAEAGTYYVILALYNADDSGTTMLSIVVEEAVIVSAEPTVIAIGEGNNVFNIEVVEGTIYELTAVPTYPASGSMNFDGGGNYTNLSFSNALGVSMLYEATTTGTLRVELNDYSYSDGPQEYSITFTAHEE
jgi:hypothetical protein